MNLKTISDNELIEKTESLVREEREVLTKLLHHLREVQRRRLYSSLKYKSLFDFAVRHLGYSEDQAYRRITAMKLLSELPEMEDKINAGEISLTHIGLAQSLFRQEEKRAEKEFTSTDKMEVLEKIAGKSVRDAERIVLSYSSSPVEFVPERIRPLGEDHVEIKFTTSKEIENKIAILKGMLAHQFPALSVAELFEKLCDLGIKTWDPSKRRRSKTAAPRKLRGKISEASEAEIRREVFRRAQNKCENCGSTYALEVDHCQPKALGGSFTLENLRLLCRSCNQRAAVKVFGVNKMEKYISPD